MEQNKDKKSVFLFCVILSLSIFLIYLPFDSGGYFAFFILFLQLVIIFLYHKIIKEFNKYIVCTLLLIAANILFCLFTWMWVQTAVNNIKVGDILGAVMTQVGITLCGYIATFTAIAVFVECVISISIRLYKLKKLTAYKSDR